MTSPSPYEQLKDDLGYLGLDAAAECFATLAEEAMTNDWPPVSYLEAVIAAQAASTRNRRLSARLRFARFPSRKTIEEFDFSFQPSVDKKLVMDLATLRFVTEGRPVLFPGPARVREVPPGDGTGDLGRRGRLPGLLQLGRRDGP